MGFFSDLFKTNNNNDLTEKHGFSIVGVSNYQDNFKKVLVRNRKYDTPLSKIKEDIYEYNLLETFNNVKLVEEPTNEFDPNAIYLEFKGKKLGYIKKGSTARVRNLLKEDHKIKVIFFGGNVKGIIDGTNQRVLLEKCLSCRIEIYTKKE